MEVLGIPGGYTGLCQPVDVGFNKPFKDCFRRLWTERARDGHYDDNADEKSRGRMDRRGVDGDEERDYNNKKHVDEDGV